MHFHWIRDLGLVPRFPERRHCRDHPAWRRWRVFSTSSAVTRRWKVVVILLVLFRSSVHTCTILVVTTSCARSYFEPSARATDWIIGQYVTINILMNLFNELIVSVSLFFQDVPISKLAGITRHGKLRICSPKERIDGNSGCVPPGKVKRSAYALAHLGCAADGPGVRFIQRSWQFWKTGDRLELSRMSRILAPLLVLS